MGWIGSDSIYISVKNGLSLYILQVGRGYLRNLHAKKRHCKDVIVV